LISYNTYTNGFVLNVKIYNPDYLGGLNKDKILYDVYIDDSRSATDAPNYLETVNSSDTATIKLTSKVRINGLTSLYNIFYVNVQLVVTDKSLVGVAALPTGSPTLSIHTFCDLIG